jgi:hypothetical protein
MARQGSSNSLQQAMTRQSSSNALQHASQGPPARIVRQDTGSPHLLTTRPLNNPVSNLESGLKPELEAEPVRSTTPNFSPQGALISAAKALPRQSLVHMASGTYLLKSPGAHPCVLSARRHDHSEGV